MVKLTIVEDRPTPKEVYNWKVYTFACLACWASVMIGYDVSLTGVDVKILVVLTLLTSLLQSAFIGTSLALQSFKDEFGLKTTTAAERTQFGVLSANIVSTYRKSLEILPLSLFTCF
jgi:hypothetical protein